MGKMFSVIKFKDIFKQLLENNPVFINSIDLKTNWTLTQNHDWKNKCIASELTIYFLIDNKNPKVFSDWECWPGFMDHLSSDDVDLYQSEFDDLKHHKFDLTRINFIKTLSNPYLTCSSTNI